MRYMSMVYMQLTSIYQLLAHLLLDCLPCSIE